jgi:hypothetical protein
VINLALGDIDMCELERCNRAVARTGQDRERNQRAVPPLDFGGRRHGMDDVANLLKCRNPRRAGRFGDPGLLRREVEVLGIRIGDTGLVAGLSGEPDEKPFQCGHGGVQRRLAQRLTAAVAPLVGKIALEGLGLLDMERLEVLVPGIILKPGNGLRYCIDALLTVALSLGKVPEVLALFC